MFFLCFFNFNDCLVAEYQRGLILGFYCYQTTNLFLSYSYLMVPVMMGVYDGCDLFSCTSQENLVPSH